MKYISIFRNHLKIKICFSLSLLPSWNFKPEPITNLNLSQHSPLPGLACLTWTNQQRFQRMLTSATRPVKIHQTWAGLGSLRMTATQEILLSSLNCMPGLKQSHWPVSGMTSCSEHHSVKTLSFFPKWDIHHVKSEAATQKGLWLPLE